jgi:hypothetical protein
MATMLRNNDSTDKHLNTVRRHTRLCKQISGTEEFVTNIQPAYNELKEKQALTQAKAEEREDAYDDLIFQDGLLDNAVRSTFEKCKQFDRDNIGQSVLKQIFPEEKFSDIIREPIASEPDEVEKIKIRIEELGDTHTLYPLAAILQERIDASRQAITALNDSIRAQKMAEAEEEITQGKLRQQYENNYLDARKKLGRQTAEMLFPKTSSRKIVVDTEE